MRSLRVHSRLLFVLFSLASLPAFSSSVANPQLVEGHLVNAAARLTPVDRLDPDQKLRLAISLPLRNPEALDKLLSQLYDPASPSFHQFLNPAQFTAAFGATEQDYQAVIDFAEANGLSVTATHPNRLLLEVNAPVKAIEKAFHLTMRVYPHPTEPRTFYAPDAEPSLDLDVPVLFIAGLNNYLTPHPSMHSHPVANRERSKPNGGGGAISTFIGPDFRAAYVPGVSLDGSGQSLGLFEFDSYYPADVSDYLTYAGITNSAVNLTNAVLASMTGFPRSGNEEVALDIAMAISMAPGLSNIIVYETPGTGSDSDVTLSHMANDNLCKQLSYSWSSFADDASAEQSFRQFAAQGQSFFAASGDVGAYVTTKLPVETPCDSTNITVVGGTTLGTTGPQGSWTSETTWSWFTQPFNGLTDEASSGGTSTIDLIPSWQKGISMTNNGGSTTHRNLPDVSMVADEISWYADNGQLIAGGGTSAAAPLWAAFTALVNQCATAHGLPTLGFLNPALYAIGKGTTFPNAFHDVTSGNSTNFTTKTAYFAVPGFDLCTGWGSPNGTNMIQALIRGLTPMSPVLSWPAPSAITYGAGLGADQLNATADVPGDFAYTPSLGAVLNAGTNTLSVVFTPTDNYDYKSATTTVAQIVVPTPLTITASDTNRSYGQPNPGFTGTIAGLQNGDPISLNYNCAATPSSDVGSYLIIPSLNDPFNRLGNYSVTTNDGTLTVSNAAVSVASGIAAANKVYDDTTSVNITFGNITLSGVLPADAANTTLSTNGFAAAFSGKDANAAALVTLSGLTLIGSAANNYTFSPPNLTASITPKPLAMSGLTVPGSKVYDGTLAAAVSGTPLLLPSEPPGTGTTADGMPYTGDTVSIVGAATGTYNSSNVVDASMVSFGGLGLGGAQAGDYVLAIQSPAPATITQAATTGLLVTSTNRALPGTDVIFTLTISPVPPGGGVPGGVVNFRIDGDIGGSVALSNGVAVFDTNSLAHGTNTVVTEYAGDGNFEGITNNLDPEEIINTPPVAGNFTILLLPNQDIQITEASILTNCSDADSDTLTLVMSTASIDGGTILDTNGLVTYTPPADITIGDSFNYTVFDGYGGSAVGTITIALEPGMNPGQTLTITDLGGGSYSINGNGVPGATYRLQYSPTLSPPNWQDVPHANVIVNNSGDLRYTNTPPAGMGFYRTVSPQ